MSKARRSGQSARTVSAIKVIYIERIYRPALFLICYFYTIKGMRKRFQNYRLIFLIFIGALVLVATSPNNMPISLLLLPFLYIYVLLFLIFFMVGAKMLDAKPLPSRLMAFSLSSIIVFLLVMRSLVNLSIFDVVIATMIMVFLIWYVRKLYAN